MGSVNKVILVGNLGRDAELRHTPGGTAVANLNLATTESWTDKNSGQKQEKTEWHRIQVWGKTAESLQEYLLKGRQVYIEGSIQTRKWTDKDGVEKFSTEIRATRVVLLGNKATNGGGGRQQQQQHDRSAGQPTEESYRQGNEMTDEEIPF